MSAVVYDLETYPNFFSCAAVSLDRDDVATFEISERANQWHTFRAWLDALRVTGVEMIGYNNLGFDYLIIHRLMTGEIEPNPAAIYAFVEKLFSLPDDAKFSLMVWQDQRLIPQIDLFKIHHFDNKARRTSLKALQFTMRSDSVEDLPIPPGTHMTREQMALTLKYNVHDIEETKKLARHTADMIDFRRKLDLDGDRLNWSDKKIGEQMLAQQLGRHVTHHWSERQGRIVPRQTPRPQGIALGDCIFPYIRFERPEFQRVLDWFKAQHITETKGVFDDAHATLDGFTFHFGTGGIHGSVARQSFKADHTADIIDVDVTSLYPSIAIVNGLAPAHLGETFVATYASMKRKRLEYAKGTPENAALKLALNGAYGDSNSQYSFLYDPQFTMSITINGQLMLCMLAERLHALQGVELIQINTDGITARVEKSARPAFEQVCAQWETETHLDLESVDYSAMYVRDVNSYLAVTLDGKVKRKGAYDYPTKAAPIGTAPSGPRAWHGNQSAMVIPKAADAALRFGIAPADFIATHADAFDFMLRHKTRGGDVTRIGDAVQQKTLRYFIAMDGEPLTVTRPPVKGKTLGDFKKKQGVTDAEYNALNVTGVWDERIHTKNQSVYAQQATAMHKGFNVAQCNHVADFDWSQLDRSYYVEKALELVDGLTA